MVRVLFAEVAGTTAQKVIQALKDEGLAVTSLMGSFAAGG